LFSRFVSLAGDVDHKVGDDLVNAAPTKPLQKLLRLLSLHQLVTCVFFSEVIDSVFTVHLCFKY
jgi:hypothetical protein